MLELRGIGLTRPGRDGPLRILDGIGFEVHRGQVFTILGPSGAGKSTLLRLCCRLEDPDEGEILLEGGDIRALPVPLLRRRVGYLAQVPALFGTSVAENLAFAADPEGKGTGLPDPERFLLQVGLTPDFLEREPGSLSVGQRQRVAFARALVAGPEVLLLDEPTSALDPGATSGVLRLVRDLRDRLGLTLIVVTHHVDQARQVADRVLVMAGGRVLEEGPPSILANPVRPETRAFLAGEGR